MLTRTPSGKHFETHIVAVDSEGEGEREEEEEAGQEAAAVEEVQACDAPPSYRATACRRALSVVGRLQVDPQPYRKHTPTHWWLPSRMKVQTLDTPTAWKHPLHSCLQGPIRRELLEMEPHFRRRDG